ncbi:MAG: hypothetical protein RI990_933 [Planctomycetota bacterium]|jgi:hypothetical protein
MSVAGSRAKLRDAHRSLMVAWEQAKQQWDDPVSQSIERHRLEPMERSVRSTLAALDAINEVLARVRRECGDEP